MQVADILHSELIQFGIDVKTKKKALQLVSKIFAEQHPELDDKTLYHDLMAREKLGSTYVGHGVAIPHCKNNKISEPIACIVRLKSYIDFSIDSNYRVNILFGLILPDKNNDDNVKILSKIAMLIDNKSFRDKLFTTKNPQEILLSLDNFNKER